MEGVGDLFQQVQEKGGLLRAQAGQKAAVKGQQAPPVLLQKIPALRGDGEEHLPSVLPGLDPAQQALVLQPLEHGCDGGWAHPQNLAQLGGGDRLLPVPVQVDQGVDLPLGPGAAPGKGVKIPCSGVKKPLI